MCKKLSDNEVNFYSYYDACYYLKIINMSPKSPTYIILKG